MSALEIDDVMSEELISDDCSSDYDENRKGANNVSTVLSTPKYVHYVRAAISNNLHPSLNKIYNRYSSVASKFENTIFYGPNNAGKYTQMLLLIHKYSLSGLKYDKRRHSKF